MRNNTVLILSDLETHAKHVEKIIGSEIVTFDAILGAIGEEYESQSMKDILQELYLSNFSHSDFEYDYINNPISKARNWRVSLTNLMQNDVGPGNINIRTAIELLKEYKESNNGKDDLHILHYLTDYSKLVKDMSDTKKIITPALVGLYLKKAENIVSKSNSWVSINNNEKKAILITMYNNGFDKTISNIEKNKNYRPNYGSGNSGGQWFIDNTVEILSLQEKRQSIVNQYRYWPDYGLKAINVFDITSTPKTNLINDADFVGLSAENSC